MPRKCVSLTHGLGGGTNKFPTSALYVREPVALRLVSHNSAPHAAMGTNSRSAESQCMSVCQGETAENDDSTYGCAHFGVMRDANV
jgi:hypothetical protein